MYLVDKSAWEQRNRSPQAAEYLEQLLAQRHAATCEITMLEILYSARNAEHYAQLRHWQTLMPCLPVDNAAVKCALDTQHSLAARGQHRLALPDLIISAVAHASGATVLHYDKDFDLIAAITEQPTEWILPRGTI